MRTGTEDAYENLKFPRFSFCCKTDWHELCCNAVVLIVYELLSIERWVSFVSLFCVIDHQKSVRVFCLAPPFFLPDFLIKYPSTEGASDEGYCYPNPFASLCDCS